MKKTKSLLMVAMVFAMFLFGFNNKAQAQYYVPVTLTSMSGFYTNWDSTDWTITLNNTTTSEQFTFYNYSYQLGDDGAYHMGYVSPGTYTVTISYSNSSVSYDAFDWYVNDQSSENYPMWGNTDYTLSTTIYATDDLDYTNPNDIGLNITMYAW